MYGSMQNPGTYRYSLLPACHDPGARMQGTTKISLDLVHHMGDLAIQVEGRILLT